MKDERQIFKINSLNKVAYEFSRRGNTKSAPKIFTARSNSNTSVPMYRFALKTKN